MDPRNYLGFGDNDLLPTKLIDTQYLETAFDDRYGDFDADGLPEIAIGRLPVGTVQEAATVVSKVTGYEKTSQTKEALFVADTTEGYDFEQLPGKCNPSYPSVSESERSSGAAIRATGRQRMQS